LTEQIGEGKRKGWKREGKLGGRKERRKEEKERERIRERKKERTLPYSLLPGYRIFGSVQYSSYVVTSCKCDRKRDILVTLSKVF
jgi:hypothetical protein